MVDVAPVVNKAEVRARVRDAESHIRALGVRRLALFGSFVREAANPESDVDLLVEFDPPRRPSTTCLPSVTSSRPPWAVASRSSRRQPSVRSSGRTS